MKLSYLLITLMIFLLSVQVSQAERTVKTVEKSIGYVSQTVSGNDYITSISFRPPDGVSQIYSFDITVRGDFQAQTEIISRFRVNGNLLSCEPSSWTTPNVNSPNYLITFSCMELVEQYKITDFDNTDLGFRTDKVAQNVFANIKITYYNDPKMPIEKIYRAVKAEISTGSTEYEVGENATIFAKVTEDGNAVSDAFCDAIIFNSSQIEIDGFQLHYINNSRGLYSNTIQAPNETGLYIVDVECFRPINASNQWHYFSAEGTPNYNYAFLNRSGSNQTHIELPDVPSGVYQCFPDRFSQSFQDFKDGTFDEIRFLSHISNITIWANKNTGATKDYTFVVQFYKQTDKGEMTLGAGINTTGINTTPRLITFPDVSVSEPFDIYSLLEVKFCIHGSEEAGKDVYIYFNGTTMNSSFVAHAIAVNYTVDFNVGGSSELKVTNSLKNINSTLFAELQEIREDIKSVNDTVLDSISHISSANHSIMSKLYLIQGDLQSINDSILSVNISIMNKLYMVQDDLQSITDDLAEISLLIDETNASTMNKLYGIQSDIYLLSSYIDSVNLTIMNKLYKVQDEIASVNETLIWHLMNITNITANITIAQQDLLDTIVALWGDQIAKPSIYMAGFTGFLPSVSAQPDDTQYICLDNETLQTRKTIILETPSENKTYVRTLKTKCTYGCINNTCVLPNYTIYIILIILIVACYLIYRHFFSI